MPQITLLLPNIRSTHNVGAIFRTADGFGVEKIIMTGYTPYPKQTNDTRLPHLRRKITEQIHKTALGAEAIIPNEYVDDLTAVIKKYRQDGYRIIALEQASNSIDLRQFKAPTKCLLILGEEVHGITSEILALVDNIVEITMVGQKESFNVSVAAGIALYQLTA